MAHNGTKLPKYIVVTPATDGTVAVHYSGNDKAAALAAFNDNPDSQGCHLSKAMGFHRKKAK